MHLSIQTGAWVCDGCGGRRELIGPHGHRALRCVDCEGGFVSTFLTRGDHELLRDADVRTEAFHFSFSSVTLNGSTVPGGVADLVGNGTAGDPSLSKPLKSIAQPGRKTIPTALIAGIYTDFSNLCVPLTMGRHIYNTCGHGGLADGEPLGLKFTLLNTPYTDPSFKAVNP